MDKAQAALSLADDTISVIQTQSELWEETYKSIKGWDGQALQALDFKDPSLKDLNTALASATKAQTDSKDKEWAVTIRGRKIKFYDVFSDVVGFIKAFETVIDPAVALDVSGKAALPWAGIKFLLGVEFTPMAGHCT
jgi:hypothetical protein